MTTTDPTPKLADQIRYAWLRHDDPTTRHAACTLSPDALRALATSATEYRTAPADAIVVPRSELPEVEEVATPGGTGTYDVGGIRLFEGPRNANDLRHRARAFLALAEYLDANPRPLAVDDRVKVVAPYRGGGMRSDALTEGDVGTVLREADEDGDILFRRDGTTGYYYLAAANVERIDDDEAPDGSIIARRLNLPDGSVIHAGGIEGAPAVGDIVRVDKAERADGETIWLPEVGTEHRVLSAADSGGDLVTETDEDGYHRIVAARNVTVMRRAER